MVNMIKSFHSWKVLIVATTRFQVSVNVTNKRGSKDLAILVQPSPSSGPNQVLETSWFNSISKTKDYMKM